MLFGIKIKLTKIGIKHRIEFVDASTVFSDPYALSMEDSYAVGEQRFVAIGKDLHGRLLTVVYTYRYNDIRLIFARLATSKERDSYDKNLF
jgi:uncharacterized protein